ncbi:MAG: HAD-IIA family hydrolase [Anaerolineae bacterium]|nr:HAD-IIA family hydrolase [Anaerolineae bacterium]
MSLDFRNIRGVITDVDGVLWRGDEPIAGAAELIAFLQGRNIPFALATNNSNKSPEDYQSKLAALKLGNLEVDQIVTSGRATASYIKQRYPAGSRVHVLGGDGLRLLLQRAGMQLTDDLPCAVVAVGIDFTLSYEKVKRASSLIRGGADFIGTNADATFPMPDGPAPGAGSILAMVATAAGKKPLVIGKPNAAMYQAALEVIGTTPEETLMVGDRIDTDIAGAQALGLKGALVLTGVSTREEAEAAKPAPDIVIHSLNELIGQWRQA